MSQGERRLAAIMFTDMVGYTALGQRNESLSLALVEEQRKLVRPVLARHRGREVKTIGDAFLVEFPSAVDAVRCAYDIQRAAREFGLSVSSENRIRLRVGIHLGEVVESQGDISGDAVNVASRIESLAEEGGVCVTRGVYEQVRGKVELPLSSIGARHLKNVAEPLEIFKMAMPWEGDSMESPGSPLNPRRIAVLPFVSLSPDPNDEFFADGLTEELITSISLLNGLEVIARTSAMNYKKEKKNVSQIGRELKVGTVLEGSVRKAGTRIRVSAQLINTNSEAHLWAENYDRDIDDIFAVQSSVAQNVASALKLKLVGAAPLSDEGKVDPEAYTTFLKASQLLNVGSPGHMKEMEALLEKAVARDPGFVKARAYYSAALVYNSAFSPDQTKAIARAEAEARRALEQDPMSADAHLALAMVHRSLDRFDEMSSELKEALRINPNLLYAVDTLGDHHLAFGRVYEAVAAFRKAAALDPLSPTVMLDLGMALRISGDLDGAIALFERMKSVHPDSATAHAGMGLCYLQKGDLREGRTSLERAVKMSPVPSMAHALLGLAYGMEGNRSEAEAHLASLEKASPVFRSIAIVMTKWGLGDAKGAMDELLAEAPTHSWYPYIMTDPLVKGLLKESRGPEFCKMVGLPPP